MKRRTPARAVFLVAGLLAAVVAGVALGSPRESVSEPVATEGVVGFRFDAKAGSRERLVESKDLTLWAECVGIADVGTHLSVSYRAGADNAVTSVAWKTGHGEDFLLFDDDFDRADGVRDLLGSGAEEAQGKLVFSSNVGAQTAIDFVADSNRPGGRCLFAGVLGQANPVPLGLR